MKKEKPKNSRYFDSMGNASGALGISVSMLKLAKKRGCPAFKSGGRVSESELLEWIKKNPATVGETKTKEDWEIKRLSLQCERIAFENAARQGELISRSEIASTIFAFHEQIKAKFSAKMIDQLPALNSGLDAGEQRINGREAFNEICGALQEFAKNYEPAA